MTKVRVCSPAPVLALTVHGPAGALDLLVPATSLVTDVAWQYAEQSGLGSIPLLYSRAGDLLQASTPVSALAVDTGAILVATTGVHRSATDGPLAGPAPDPEPTAPWVGALRALALVSLLGAAGFPWAAHPVSPPPMPGATWAILLAVGLLAAWFAPVLAVRVPVQCLVDDAPPLAPPVVVIRTVAAIAERGGRVVTTSAAAVLVSSLVGAPMLLWTVSLPVDRVGARLEVALVGASLLLSSRGCRHGLARGLLRLAGLACWAALAAYAAPRLSQSLQVMVSFGVIGLGLVMVLVVVAGGRGWRSAWWARGAEIGEALCGSSALAVVLVASGLFRHVWELTS